MRAVLSCVADGFRITRARSESDIDAVRGLCWAYRDFLLNVAPIERDTTQTFYPLPKYRELMEDLAVVHARPQGELLLATVDGAPVGCGMSHSLDAQTSEIKRVFVTEGARGMGIARALCTQLIEQARTDGFIHVVLDTTTGLAAAHRLYDSLGFTRRGPYQAVPDHLLAHLIFFERKL